MGDRLCDWQGCDSPHVNPAILAVAREPGDPDHVQPIARQFELCPPHTQMLVLWVNTLHVPLDELPLDPGAGQ